MANEKIASINEFRFRDLHPDVSMGTASDRYAGWIGRIYSRDRYKSKISSRSTNVGGETFKQEVLPVESVEEYFQHFSVLELDFTFYRVLLEKESEPTHNFHVLQTYRRYLRESDHLILKVPQVVFAQRMWRGGKFLENPDYLNPEIFIHQFYEPALGILGDLITGFIFEQEYQPKKDRILPDRFAGALDEFFEKIPKDDRYHVESRTESYLSRSYFDVLEKHGVGQVFSHWTWLPPLRKQFLKSDRRFLNSGNQCIIRLMTPLKMRYEDAFKKAYPFDKMVDGMMSTHMVEETAALMSAGIDEGVHVNVIINNRAGGNAPIIAQKVAEKFLAAHSEGK